MSKHTPEPWRICEPFEGAGGYEIADSAMNRVCCDITEINANRIVTCVNACAGMADPAAEIAELKRQRDELLGLVKAVSYHSIPATVDGIKCAAFPWEEYESMVKKAKGSAS